MKDHKENKITWQAHTVKVVNEDCLNEGKFPNGKKLKHSDIEYLKSEIKVCNDTLINYECIDNQIKMEL